MRKTLAALLLCFTTLGLTYAQKQFWGSASFGGLYNDGFIFKTDSIGDNLQIVHHFQRAVDGENISALMLGSNNKLYGVASSGGTGGENVLATGTFFEYDLATDQFRILEHFGPANTKLPGITTPRAEGVPSLFEVSPGIIFILMYQGRYVYSYNVATGVFTKPFTIPSYQGGATNSTLQNTLNQTFHKAADGFLYASTQTNSMCPIPNPNMGSIIRVNPANNAISIRHKANCLIDYGYKYNGFFAEKDGKLYSTTLFGGTNNQGVIFEYNPTANTFTKLHDFAGSVYNYEVTSLVLAKNGKLYGTAYGGGIPEPALMLNSGGGILFEFDPTTNVFAKKHDFTLTGQSIYDMGIFPSGLISSTNGKLYGATQYGVFEYNPTTQAIRVAGRFVGQAFAPSFVQVCRKPAYYQAQTVTNFTICKDAPFTLDMASTNANSVVWRHNNIVDATRTTTALSFTSFSSTDAGAWVCTLTNECGTTVAQTITLEYGTPDKPMVAASGPLTFCEGGSVILSAPTGFSSYMWSTGEGTQEITVNERGAYSVFVSNGCESPVSETISVTVNELPSPPTIIAEGSLIFCEGENVILSAPEGFTSYSWSTGETSRQIAVTETGSYTVKVNDGCESPASEVVSVTVNELPLATIMPAGPVVFCEGENVTLSAPDGFTAYSWSTGETSRQITIMESGSYTVVVRNDCESAVSEAVSVVVNQLPLPVVITAAGPLVFCEGENVILSAPEGFVSYSWSTGETSRQITVDKSGSYTVKVNDVCDSPPSEAVSVTANALPQAPTNIMSGEMLTAIGGSGTYAWTLNDVALDDHASQITPMETGIYKAYSVSAEGCRSVDFATISFVVSGTEPREENTIVVYPNPGQGTLNLEVGDALLGQTNVSVLSTTGSVVYRRSINFGPGPTTIHLGKLPAGLYHLMIRKGSQVIIRKIVIR